jgi:hypothetical protein
MSERDTDMVTRSSALLSPAPAELTEEEKKKTAQTTPLQCSQAGLTNCRGGCLACMRFHQSAAKGSRITEAARVSRTVLGLQRSYGNQQMQRLISRAGEGGAEASPEIEEGIQQKRGSGHPLEDGVRRQMETSMGADFGGVRVHQDAPAHDLNRALNAKAFTTGKDIFFSEGAYRPGTSGGRELLAHELTHVVQQTGDGIRTKLSVSEPGDAMEQEADQVAKSVVAGEHHQEQAQRQPELPAPEEETKKKEEAPT